MTPTFSTRLKLAIQLSGQRISAAKRRDGRIEALRAVRRRARPRSRRAGLQQLRHTIVAAPDAARDQLRRRSDMQLIRGPAASRPDMIAFRDPAIATRIALPSLARCLLDVSTEIDELDELIAPLVEVLAAADASARRLRCPGRRAAASHRRRQPGAALKRGGLGDAPRLGAVARLLGSDATPSPQPRRRPRSQHRTGHEEHVAAGPHDALVAEFDKNDPRAIRRALRLSLHYLDRHGSVAACESGVRAWVVFGDKDDVGLFDDERRGLEGCPRVTSVSIPDTGHFTRKPTPVRSRS